jgi:hypothetical protein
MQRTSVSFGGYRDKKSNIAQVALRKRHKKSFLNIIEEEGFIRYFNQIELERLQGFKDGYTSILSWNKSMSLLGDGWTLPIIEHIFKFIEQ